MHLRMVPERGNVAFVARSKQMYIEWLEATVLLSHLRGLTSDLGTQCLSRQQQAESILDAGACTPKENYCE